MRVLIILAIIILPELGYSQVSSKEKAKEPHATEARLGDMISKYGKKKGRMIAEGRVWPSISYEMAIDSWGTPKNIEKTSLAVGETQKWIYPENRYLYFKNGRLEAWK